MYRPRPLPYNSKEYNDQRIIDHGGLDIHILEDMELRATVPRHIYHSFQNDVPYAQLISQPEDDDMNDLYYAFDDDVARNPYNGWVDDAIQDTKECRRTSFHRDLPINCNMLHEYDIQTQFRHGTTKYLGAGAYREAYISNLKHQEFSDLNVIFKGTFYISPFPFEVRFFFSQNLSSFYCALFYKRRLHTILLSNARTKQ